MASRYGWTIHACEGHVVLKNVLFAPLVLEGKTVGIIGLANKARFRPPGTPTRAYPFWGVGRHFPAKQHQPGTAGPVGGEQEATIRNI